MSFKESVKKSFKNEEEIVLERYVGAKFIFIIFTFIFFINFFFVGAGFYDSFFMDTLVYTYALFLFSLSNYLYFYIHKSFLGKISNTLKISLIILFSLFFMLFLFPFIVEGGFLPTIRDHFLPFIDSYIKPFIF